MNLTQRKNRSRKNEDRKDNNLSLAICQIPYQINFLMQAKNLTYKTQKFSDFWVLKSALHNAENDCFFQKPFSALCSSNSVPLPYAFYYLKHLSLASLTKTTFFQK